MEKTYHTSIIIWYVNSLYAARCTDFYSVYIYRTKRGCWCFIQRHCIITYSSSSTCRQIFYYLVYNRALLYYYQTFLRLKLKTVLFLTSICRFPLFQFNFILFHFHLYNRDFQQLRCVVLLLFIDILELNFGLHIPFSEAGNIFYHYTLTHTYSYFLLRISIFIQKVFIYLYNWFTWSIVIPAFVAHFWSHFTLKYNYKKLWCAFSHLYLRTSVTYYCHITLYSFFNS